MIVDMVTPHSPEEMSDELKAKLKESIRYLKSFTPPRLTNIGWRFPEGRTPLY